MYITYKGDMIPHSSDTALLAAERSVTALCRVFLPVFLM